ncbi:MAG: SRPBCC family protein [Actinomycetota bacterium]|nr:SRPBCC family protein [Actinomycetota bacterium]
MTIDRHAPAIARAEIEIAASPETVWEVLAAIDRWPGWNPDVKSVSLSEAVAEGAPPRLEPRREVGVAERGGRRGNRVHLEGGPRDDRLEA